MRNVFGQPVVSFLGCGYQNLLVVGVVTPGVPIKVAVITPIINAMYRLSLSNWRQGGAGIGLWMRLVPVACRVFRGLALRFTMRKLLMARVGGRMCL